MNPDPLVRYLQRLPTLITFFFSVMLVTVFRELSVTFHWTTDPSFDINNPSHILIVVAFLATLFFVVSVWLAYSLLIERFPYTLHYGVFFFDVARFSILFIIFNFAFLAGNPPHYVDYILMLVLWHVMMAGWHAHRLRHIQGVERQERAVDMPRPFFASVNLSDPGGDLRGWRHHALGNSPALGISRRYRDYHQRVPHHVECEAIGRTTQQSFASPGCRQTSGSDGC